MSRGKKLDLFIGADISDSWEEVDTPRKSKIADEILEAKKHFLFFSKEKHRGKTVTLVGEFHLSKEERASILKSLKKKLGCGGRFKNGFMEFQGECKEQIRPLLLALNFRFRQGH